MLWNLNFAVACAAMALPACPVRAAVSETGANTLVLTCQASATNQGQLEPEVLDFRYAPERSQACLGLPDDPFKTILGSDGGLYYEYPKEGPESYSLGAGSFGTRLLFEVETPGAPGPKQQSLHSPRVPVVTTRYQQGALSIEQTAWANTPPGKTVDIWSPQRMDFLRATLKNTGQQPASGKMRLHVGTSNRLKLSEDNTRLVMAKDPSQSYCVFSRPCLPVVAEKAPATLVSLERLRVNRNWGRPNKSAAASFRHVVVSRKQMSFEYSAEKGRQYVVALGLLESYYAEPEKRALEILVEGRSVAQIDLVKLHGQNTPVVLTYAAADHNGDGTLDITLQAAPGSRDQNVTLSGLWIYPADAAPSAEQILAGTARVQPLAVVDADHLPSTIPPLVLTWDLGTLPPGGRYDLDIAVPQGEKAKRQVTKFNAQAELKQAIRYWEKAPLPYGKIQVADPAVQALMDSCIRNIYQAREIKNGLPAFQVGPTMYRGLWVVDGAFLLEAATFLGRADEARLGIDYLLSFQRPDGSFLIIPNHWKETGIVLWAVTQHARLTGDKTWLASLWPRLEKCWETIRSMRQQASTDPAALYAGLLLPGMSDGGLHGPAPEYTNVYWTLAGMRAAIEAALWLGKNEQAAAWQKELDDFMATFRKAAQRDMRNDGHGNRCLPITMNSPKGIPVQKAQWGFMHAVFPGQLFSPDDELVRGNMAMLQANEREGLVFDTGWLEQGLWNYFGSFYGHAWLWLGDGKKAASTLYAFGNHASPLMCWREEQMPVGETVKGLKRAYVGDMPHNWASAEFIRLVRHLAILERGKELHLLQGLPQAWTKPNAKNLFRDIPTRFGLVSLTLRVAADGNKATLEFEPPRREPADKIVLHLEGFAREVEHMTVNGRAVAPEGAMVPLQFKSTTVVITFKSTN